MEEGEDASMSTAVIRKLVVVVEETRREMGRDIAPPTRKAAAIAVIENRSPAASSRIWSR